jgi:hypothetical protein
MNAPIHEKPIGPGYKAIVYIDEDEFVVATQHTLFGRKEASRHGREPDAIKAMVEMADEKYKRIRGLADQLKPLAGGLRSMGAEGLMEFAERMGKKKK